MADHLTELYRHNRWANLRLLDWCESVDPALLEESAPGTYGEAGKTLTHLAAAEERYIEYLTGELMPPGRRLDESGPFPGFDVLRERLAASGERLIELSGTVPGDRVLRGNKLNGEPYEVRATTLIIQVINHATEHRAHIMTVISQHGVEAPEIDGWTYGEECLPPA